ncbi:MAG TPA: hypothetical protein PK092_09435 [Chitinophagaceae bacterium]|nr:hypothetical protein [Chitinophagaceae bacterium]
MKKNIFLFTIVSLGFLFSNTKTEAQQYKFRQVTNMMGMKMETTIYVKGMRKRTEPGSMMGMPASPITIEQCDLQRTIKINDKKKLYYIEPFAKDDEEIIDEDVKTVPKTKTPPKPTTTQKGGIIYISYSITDTGERKKMYGFNARHVWTSNKMVPSPESCTMKDSLLIKTDGWYIDLPQFNCPVNYKRYNNPQQTDRQKPECTDKFVTRRRGKGKLGFPLIETTTIIMGDGKKSTSQFETNLETLELTTAKLDSMLFEIPIGYTETKNEQDLQDKLDINDIMNQYKKNNNNNDNDKPAANDPKGEGKIRIGVLVPTGDEQVNAADLQQYLAGILISGTVEAVAVSSEEEAKSSQCDYSLATTFVRVKSGSKVGGLLKAVKNADPNAASSFTIEANMLLKSLGDGSVKAQPKIDGKFEGKIDDAAKKAMDDGSRQVLRAIK